MPGHLFIVHADLTSIACDALLVPTDDGFNLTEAWDSLELEIPGQRWGGRNTIRHRQNPDEPEVWLGRIGQAGDDNTFAVFEPAIEEFVIRAASVIDINRKGRICPWPRLRLALNVVGSGEGGARTRKGGLIDGLVKVLRELARAHDVDIIFATYGDKAYAAAQRARSKQLAGKVTTRPPGTKELVSEWRFEDFAPEDLHIQAERLAAVAAQNRLVLFIGAGASVGAGGPDWPTLLRRVAERGRISGDYLSLLEGRDYRDWATLIDRKLVPNNDIHSLIAAELKQLKRYSLQHALLASLPSNEAVTTNFDQLFELASRVADRDISVLPTHPSRSAESWLLKLHGSVDDPAKMVLTRADYLNMPRTRGALMGLVQGLLLTRHMVYVGYSLTDEDFHELTHEVRTAIGDSTAQRATLITLAADPAQNDLWEDELQIVSMGLRREEKSERLHDAGRQVEIFLDLVGFLSTTSAAFFLDPAFSELSEDAATLRSALEKLAESVNNNQSNNPVVSMVHDFLLTLGRGDSQDASIYTERLTVSDHSCARIRIRRNRFECAPGPVEGKLRDVAFLFHWNPNDRAPHRCGTLSVHDVHTFSKLVEPGERLQITFDTERGPVLR